MYTTRLIDTHRTFRVGKVVCLGRNYAEHIAELGNAVPDRPVIFLKPATSIIGAGEQIVIPGYSRECHHEVELALLIGKWGKNIAAADAMQHIAGYGVAIDLTLRDVQNELKQKGLPWEIAKGFDTSCPLSDFRAAADIADPHQLPLRLWVNDQLRQEGNSAQMIHRIPAILHEISKIFTLEEGDVILTGTPSGVGPVVSGDRLCAEIGQVGSLDVTVR